MRRRLHLAAAAALIAAAFASVASLPSGPSLRGEALLSGDHGSGDHGASGARASVGCASPLCLLGIH